ncbi:hypothetical protein GA0070617_2641 [Micromonospora yangpuensis]|uniref:Uncharacterized protein n=1 Tax=Micromonospora yangpuensis TaxID=683228 RepID=A0A1C6UJY7_9ACTN|nr:hypothetical protein GA0070617_2641 [Micromonospora yangpuensis]
MIPRDDHHRGPRFHHQPGLRLVPQTDSVRRWHRPVVEVTGDKHRIDPFTAGDVHQVIDERLMGIVQAEAVQLTTQMPVRGVKETHER